MDSPMVPEVVIPPEEPYVDVDNPPEIQQARRDICFACEKFKSDDRTCLECGCPVIMMCQLNFKSCPLGKW